MSRKRHDNLTINLEIGARTQAACGSTLTFCQEPIFAVWPFKKYAQTNTPFGSVIFRRGAWEGVTQLPHSGSPPVPTIIHAPKTAGLSELTSVRSVIDQRYDHLACQIADEAIPTYRMYAEEDLRHGNIEAQDLRNYPSVDDRNGIWNLLTPFRLEVFPEEPEYDFFISYDVAWWNPHYFLAFFSGDKLTHLHVDG